MKTMIIITVFAESLAFHQQLHMAKETVSGIGFIILVLGLKKQQRENGSVKIVKRCKFIILRNRNITLVNQNKEFELNLLVGSGSMEHPDSLSCEQRLLNTTPEYFMEF